MSLEYFAGYFDADGHVSGAIRPHAGMLLKIGVTGSILKRLEEFEDSFGGQIHVISRKGEGVRIISKRTTWQWQVWAAKGEEFVQAMLPHVRSKKRQLELFLEMRSTVRRTNCGSQPLPEGTWELRHRRLDEMRGLNQGKYSKT